MNVHDDNTSIYSKLLQLMFEAKHRTFAMGEDFDLTVMQSGVLMTLNADESKPMRVLSDYFMCDASTVTGLVDRLESRGLIQRQNHPTDRRIKLIGLTARGIKLKNDIQAKMKQIENDRLATILSPSERATLSELLDRIIDDPQDR